MKKLLRVIIFFLAGSFTIFTGIRVSAQNVCVSGNVISPGSAQNICIGSSANTLTATISTNGSGSNGNITYNWYSNTINSTTGGTLVQTFSTTTETTTNTFTPPAILAGTLWYYSITTNDGGDCAGTTFTSAVVQVNVNSLPAVFNVTGGGTRCSNGPVAGIYLSNSEIGINYQLKRGSPVGTILAGTGRPIGFGISTAGTFSMAATNNLTGCASNMEGTATVSINPAPSASYTKTDISCEGADGSITVTGQGGSPAYLFNVDGGDYSSSNVFSGLTAGNHTVKVKDANSCSISIPNISVQNSPTLIAGINLVSPGNCTGNDGSILVKRIGGVDDGITPVEYKLDGDISRPYQSSTLFGGLSKGNYTVTVKDSKGCTAESAAITLTQEAGTTPVVFNVAGGGTRCSDGAGVGILLDGSENGVNYQLEKGGIPIGSVLAGSGQPLSFLISNNGTYKILATNVAAGCTSDMNGDATITVNPSPQIFNVSGGGTRCSNGLGIGIVLNSSEKKAKYQLVKDGFPVSGTLPGTDASISFLVKNAGGFTVIATDSITGCHSNMNGSATILVNQSPAVFNVSGGGAKCGGTSQKPITVNGSENGINYQLIRGGIPVGTSLSGNGTSLTFLTATVGTYKILATNATSACNAIMNDSAKVIQNPSLTPSFTKYYASSCVGGDGTITVTGNGGTPGYVYSIDGGSFDANNQFTGLVAGDHKIIVKDANSCTFTYEGITVLTAPIMRVTASTIPTGACDGNDGSITAFAYGGVGDGITPLEYRLEGEVSRPFQTGNTFSALPVGSYIVTIKDSKGCLAQSSAITLKTSTPVNFIDASYSTDVSICGNGHDARIAVGVTGGFPPYHFKLNGTEYGESLIPSFGFKDLGAGTYTIEVTDIHECGVSKQFTIGTAGAPVARISYRGNETCIGGNDGYISLSPSDIGGVPPQYGYSKDGGVTFQTSFGFTHLSAGTYSMIVKDSKGCQSAPVSVFIAPGKGNCIVNKTVPNPVQYRKDSSVAGRKDPVELVINSVLNVSAYPNPFGSEFTLEVKGNNKAKIDIVVSDVLGRIIETRSGNANQQYELGGKLRQGVYIVRVTQKNAVQTIKIVKE